MTSLEELENRFNKLDSFPYSDSTSLWNAVAKAYNTPDGISMFVIASNDGVIICGVNVVMRAFMSLYLQNMDVLYEHVKEFFVKHSLEPSNEDVLSYTYTWVMQRMSIMFLTDASKITFPLTAV